ncbi:hypothetical protein EGC79_02545 [Shewanella vesiculosa]|nr:hypothetical protein EGC79_02545 [Shewanella vesiculosa]
MVKHLLCLTSKAVNLSPSKFIPKSKNSSAKTCEDEVVKIKNKNDNIFILLCNHNELISKKLSPLMKFQILTFAYQQ